MTLQYNGNVPTLSQLQNAIQAQLGDKYECTVMHDRWTVNFSGAQCVLVRKSGTVGVCVAINDKKQKVDVDGVVPNKYLEQLFFKNYLTRLFLISSWNKVEKEVAEAIRAQLS